MQKIWSGRNGVGTVAVTLVGSIAYFTRVCQLCLMLLESASSLTLARVAVTLALINGTVVTFSTTFFQFTTCKDAGSPSNIGPTQG